MEYFRISYLGLEVMSQNLKDPMTWKKANDYCNNIGDGWRLPSAKELLFLSTIYDVGNIGNFYFPENKYEEGNWNDPNDKYWSIEDSEFTTKATIGSDGRSRYARWVDLRSKTTDTFKKSLPLRMRLVRDI